MGRKVRWGVLGSGRIAMGAHVPAIVHSSNGVLVGVATRGAARRAELAASAAGWAVHDSYEELLADQSIDAIYIGLPNGLHESWVLAAARAGKHVLCDKSLALDTGAALRMREACSAANVRLMEGFMIRHHPQWDRVRELVAQGALGTMRTIHAWLTGTAADDDHRWSAELGGGALFDVTAYGINIARLLTQEEPTQIVATAQMRGRVDESSQVSLRFPSGVLATATGSLGAAATQGVHIVGDKGELRVPSPVVPHFEPTTLTLAAGGEVFTPHVPGANHFLHQVEHFSACVLDPTRPLWPAEDGVANVTVCDVARRAFTR
jgi:D-xylose 1-dehydrogenase (NADP+, D-xylono-1,5-lactone-forming)